MSVKLLAAENRWLRGKTGDARHKNTVKEAFVILQHAKKNPAMPQRTASRRDLYLYASQWGHRIRPPALQAAPGIGARTKPVSIQQRSPIRRGCGQVSSKCMGYPQPTVNRCAPSTVIDHTVQVHLANGSCVPCGVSRRQSPWTGPGGSQDATHVRHANLRQPNLPTTNQEKSSPRACSPRAWTLPPNGVGAPGAAPGTKPPVC